MYNLRQIRETPQRLKLCKILKSHCPCFISNRHFILNRILQTSKNYKYYIVGTVRENYTTLMKRSRYDSDV